MYGVMKALLAASGLIAFIGSLMIPAQALSLDRRLFDPAPSPEARIDVMFLYTPRARLELSRGFDALEDSLDHVVDVMNNLYKDSGVAMRVRLVHHESVGTPFTDNVGLLVDENGNLTGATVNSYTSAESLTDLVQRQGIFSGVDALRRLKGADFVTVFRSIVGEGGRAPIIPVHDPALLDDIPDYYNISRALNGPLTVAHEMGHNMGLGHSNRQIAAAGGRGAGNTIYANGYAIDGTEANPGFGTLMVSGLYENAPRIPMISNPLRLCGAQQLPCGIGFEAFDIPAEQADAAYHLNQNRFIYANALEPLLHGLTFVDPVLANCVLGHGDVGTKVSEVRGLNCANQGIRLLEGVERLDSVRFIDVSNNQIRDLEPLTQLPLQAFVGSINLSGNDNILCRRLDELAQTLSNPSALLRPERCFDPAPLVAAITLL